MHALTVFHYHLLPGGVTEVIKKASIAILSRIPEVERIELVTGRPANGDAVLEEIRAELPGPRRGDISLTILPQIDYAEHGGGDTWQQIAETLRRRWSAPGTVWWVHNYHLGKNPAFTRALIESIRTDPSRRAVFQVHDFPESSRYENLRQLRETTGSDLYPASPGLRYAVINDRDRQLLTDAGIPEPLVVPLPNPVSVPELPSLAPASRAAIRREMAAASSRFLPASPLLVYPVRTIRRKNVLEAALLAAASDPPLNLLVTLPGVSGPEKPYSDLVEGAYREGLIPGVWGANLPPHLGFRDTLAASDLVVSSSVQEGFGYLFAESVAWGKPLFARQLDVAGQFAPLFDGYPAYLYDRLMVPLTRRQRDEAKAAYRQKIASLHTLVPEEYLAAAQAALLRMFSRECADVSFLSAAEQLRILRDLARGLALGGMAGEIRDLNRETFAALRRLAFREPAGNMPAGPGAGTCVDGTAVDFPASGRTTTGRARVERLFGSDAYAERVRRLLAGLAKALPTEALPVAAAGSGVHERLVAAFARPEQMRLLLG